MERASEMGEEKVQFLPKAHALVAQWIEQAHSRGKVAGSSPAEGAPIYLKLVDLLAIVAVCCWI